MVIIDDDRKGFLRGVVSGPDENISEEILSKMQQYIREKTKKEPTLTYEKNEKITAGFKIKLEDMELDATIDNQFKILKTEILGN